MAHGECGVRNSGSFIEIGKGVGEEGKQGALAEKGRGRRRGRGGLDLVLWWWCKRPGGLYRRDREQAVDAAPVVFRQAAG
jgi:hypothetical protein